MASNIGIHTRNHFCMNAEANTPSAFHSQCLCLLYWLLNVNFTIHICAAIRRYIGTNNISRIYFVNNIALLRKFCANIIASYANSAIQREYVTNFRMVITCIVWHSEMGEWQPDERTETNDKYVAFMVATNRKIVKMFGRARRFILVFLLVFRWTRGGRCCSLTQRII